MIFSPWQPVTTKQLKQTESTRVYEEYTVTMPKKNLAMLQER